MSKCAEVDEKSRQPQTYSTGDTFAGKFRIVSKIGSGGFGSVYRAHDINLGRDVALKILHSWVLAHSDNRARFVREAKILTDLHDPHIIHVYSFGIEENGRCYMSMEFLQGKTLSACLAGSRALEWREAASIGVQICHAMGVAHAHGIIHRDLKPDNIMLLPSADGPIVKVLDFGLCGVLPDGPQELQRLTQTGAVMGSAHYMSPEVCMGMKADQRSDVYSVGCVIYELLSGRKPVASDDAIAVMYAQTKELPDRLNTAQVETVPLDLELSVFKAIQKESDQRFQTMRAFEDALVAVLEGDRPSVKPEAVKLSSARHEPVQLPARRTLNPVLAIVAAVVLIGTAAGIYLLVNRQQSSDKLFFQASAIFRKAHDAASSEIEQRAQYRQSADMFTEALLHAPQNWRYQEDARLQRLLAWAAEDERQKVRDEATSYLRDLRLETDPWSDFRYECLHQLTMVNIHDKRQRDSLLCARNNVGYTMHFAKNYRPAYTEAMLDYGEAYWGDKELVGVQSYADVLSWLPPFDANYGNMLRQPALEPSAENSSGSSYSHEDFVHEMQQNNLRRAIHAKLSLAKWYLGLAPPAVPQNRVVARRLLEEIRALYKSRTLVPEFDEAELLFKKYYQQVPPEPAPH
jgi:serine/threonine protein kinase